MHGHPFIIELVEIHETDSHVYIITELLEGGPIFHYGKIYKERTVLNTGKPILEALVSLERMGIVQ